jgi:hypothetical protein
MKKKDIDVESIQIICKKIDPLQMFYNDFNCNLNNKKLLVNFFNVFVYTM